MMTTLPTAPAPAASPCTSFVPRPSNYRSYLCIYSYLYYYFALFLLRVCCSCCCFGCGCGCHSLRLCLSFSATFDAFACVFPMPCNKPNPHPSLLVATACYCCLSVLFIVKAALMLAGSVRLACLALPGCLGCLACLGLGLMMLASLKSS